MILRQLTVKNLLFQRIAYLELLFLFGEYQIFQVIDVLSQK
jgi:hypothetical protein